MQAQAGGAPVGYSLLLTSQPTGPRTNIEIRSGGEQRLAIIPLLTIYKLTGVGVGVVDSIISSPEQRLQNFSLSADHRPWSNNSQSME